MVGRSHRIGFMNSLVSFLQGNAFEANDDDDEEEEMGSFEVEAEDSDDEEWIPDDDDGGIDHNGDEDDVDQDMSVSAYGENDET